MEVRLVMHANLGLQLRILVEAFSRDEGVLRHQRMCFVQRLVWAVSIRRDIGQPVVARTQRSGSIYLNQGSNEIFGIQPSSKLASPDP